MGYDLRAIVRALPALNWVAVPSLQQLAKNKGFKTEHSLGSLSRHISYVSDAGTVSAPQASQCYGLICGNG